MKHKIAQVQELEARIIREIRRQRADSRLKLALQLQLAPSTVGIYVDRLITAGFLSEEPLGGKQPRRGRPAQSLYLRGAAGCFVGAEFEAEALHANCVDFSGQVLARHSSRLPRGSDAEGVMTGLEAAIRSVLDAQKLPLLGIGIGAPGIIDAERGTALDYRFIRGWTNVPVARRLRETFKVPVVVENNALATALGNLLFDPSHRPGDFVNFLVRSGVGAGLVINGALYRGDSFLAGEVGRIQQMTTAQDGPLAETMEDSASTQGIVQFVTRQLPQHPSSVLQRYRAELTIRDVIAAAQGGDELARLGLQRAARTLGWLAHVVTLVINPAFIVLTSPLNVLGEWFRLEVQAALSGYASRTRSELRVYLSGLNEEAGALGAASLALDSWKPNHDGRIKEPHEPTAVS